MVDAKFLDINGKKKHLSDYMSNKYLLLNFGGGCGHFKASLPELEEVSETYNENLTLIVINVDTKAQWRELMAKYNIPGVNLHDPKTVRGLAYKYGAKFTIPHYVIISPEGRVVDRWTGYPGKGSIKGKLNENVLCFGSTE
jgi:thiol-disulfide isomerase/thioredoxin